MGSSPMHMDDNVKAPALKAGKPPITASPAFPWIVALWFAALLGIGSLILPNTMLERAVLATGLAAEFPATAPPLGFTAKALLALVGTLAGGAFGLLLARRIAAFRNGRQPLISATSTGKHGVDGRAEGPVLLERAKVSESASDAEQEPFELEEIAVLPETLPGGESSAGAHRGENEPIVAPGYSEPAEARATAAEYEPTSGRDPETWTQSEEPVSENHTFQTPDKPDVETDDEAHVTNCDAGPVLDSSIVREDSDSDGLVQLVQRLGSTLEKHREWVARNAARAAAEASIPGADTRETQDEAEAPRTEVLQCEAPVSEEFEPAGPEDVSQAMAAYFGAASASAGTEDDHADLAASFTLPILKEKKPVETPRHSNDDNQRALREALMNLQRMSN